MSSSRPIVWVTAFAYITPAVTTNKLVRTVTRG